MNNYNQLRQQVRANKKLYAFFGHIKLGFYLRGPFTMLLDFDFSKINLFLPIGFYSSFLF